MQRALETLIEAHADRAAAVRRAKASGLVPVAYLGGDVPRELLAAAGFVPVRLAGDPRESLADERMLGEGVDAVARTQLCAILRQGRTLFERLILSHDGEGTLRLFHALRELRRWEPERALPELHFFDFLQLPRASTERYNRQRIGELIGVLEGWAGRSIGTQEAGRAVIQEDERLGLLGKLQALRAQVPARVSGVEALAIVGASTVLPVEEFSPLLDAALHELEQRAPLAGTRVFVTGSDWDHPGLYAAIEARGCVVVGEDHGSGRGVSSAVRARSTVQAALRARAERVLCVLRAGDDAPAWDLPEQRAQLAAAGLAFSIVPAQPYAGPYERSVSAALGAA